MTNSKDIDTLISEIPESYQRYLDEIYTISRKKKGGWITNKEISESLNVKPASVSGMLHNLKEKGLINWAERKSIRLTEKGRRQPPHACPPGMGTGHGPALPADALPHLSELRTTLIIIKAAELASFSSVFSVSSPQISPRVGWWFFGRCFAGIGGPGRGQVIGDGDSRP